MPQAERKDVYKVYDEIAAWFLQNRDLRLIEKGYLDEAIDLLPDKASALDLGCGTGKPILQYLLNRGLQVTGVDASVRMLEMAKENFPVVDFILQDMRLLHLGKKFDLLIAWHSFFHLPNEDQPAVFDLFEEHILTGGILIFTSGTDHGEAWGMNGGENLFHASLDADAYGRLLHQHHFEVLKHHINDPDCGGATVWVAKYRS